MKEMDESTSVDIERLVIKKGSFRIREDNDNFFILVNRDKNKWLSANQVTLDLINLADGKKSIKEIINEFSMNFEDTDIEIIRRDVLETFRIALKCNFVFAKEN